jgi:DNA invertase Pin-like site-specific DNA recombinase
MDTITNRAKAYSYIRFSRPEQMTGDSLRRQTEAARAYCEHHGLDLTDLTYRDLGVSAAAGANAEVGALGQFIQAVESGRVERGSYLLIEKMDRLSRDTVRAARDRFEALLDAGIVIITVNPERVYRAESYDLTDMIVTLVDMSQSRQFVENLSYRVGEAWRNKRERAAKDGHKLTARCPAWLRLKNGSFEVIEERATIVRQIFDWTARGHGKAAIARQLNGEEVSTFGKATGWHASYIQKILRNPAVIGIYQPMKRVRKFEKARTTAGEAIINYFPAVVEESVYYAVKQMKPAPSGKGKSPLRNVLSGLAYCARCGGKLHFVNKGAPPKGGTYLACDAARRKGECTAKSVRYEPVLDQVLAAIKSFREIVQDDSAAKEREREIDALGGKIEETEKLIEGLVTKVERTESATLERRLIEREAELRVLKTKRQELREKVIAREDGRSFDGVAFDTFLDTSPRLPSSKTSAQDLTVHIAAELRRMVERVEIEKDKTIRVTPKAGAYEAVPQREQPKLIARKRKPL